jgi:hypothetical protein
MTFTFNMTVTAKTETMLQDEMQQELLNLIGAYIAALPTEAEADRAFKGMEITVYLADILRRWFKQSPGHTARLYRGRQGCLAGGSPMIRDMIGGAVFIIALSLVCAFIATL